VAERESRYQQLAAAERRAWEEAVRGRQIELRPVRCSAAPPPPSPTWWLPAALIAALAMAAGVGAVSAGMAADRPLCSRADVEAAVPAPVVGVIPAPDPGRPTDARSPRAWSRPALLALGALLVGSSIAALLFAVKW